MPAIIDPTTAPNFTEEQLKELVERAKKEIETSTKELLWKLPEARHILVLVDWGTKYRQLPLPRFFVSASENQAIHDTSMGAMTVLLSDLMTSSMLNLLHNNVLGIERQLVGLMNEKAAAENKNAAASKLNDLEKAENAATPPPQEEEKK